MLIYAIVNAPDPDTALTTARRSVFDRLVGATLDSCAEFDYYITFNKDRSCLPTRKDGSEIPIAARLNSAIGQELLARGWNATKTSFENNLAKVRKALASLSDEEIMNNSDLVRHRCAKLGAYAGPSVYLYDEFGNGIRTPEDFVWKCKDIEQPWIVPAYAKY